MKYISNKYLVFSIAAMLFCANSLKAQQPTGTPLLSAELNNFVPIGLESVTSTISEVPVEGQSFNKALRLNTYNQKNFEGEVGITLPITTPIKKGDILWLTFQSRCVKSTRESGEALVEVRLDELIDGKYEWPSFMERGISVNGKWTHTSIPIEIKNLPFHSKSNGEVLDPKHLRLFFRFDKVPQIIEVASVSLLNCGNTISISDIPRSKVNYEGDAVDAPWRKEAAERIEKNRKGDLSITVVDKNGKKIPNAKVAVRMTRNAFKWGTCTSSYMLSSETPNAKMYRDTLSRYFNQIVFENELKMKNWEKIKTFEPAYKSINWLKNRNISVNGSVVLWPSWKHSPSGLDSLKNDTLALRKVMLDWVHFLTASFKGQMPEWDVINEITYHHNIVDIVGKQEMVKWYKEAHKCDPAAKLYMNDFTMFHQKENNADGVDCEYEFNTIKYLVDNGAPIQAIAEQAHVGGTPPGIPLVLARLDKFSAFKLPIAISEFDIYSDDDDFKARYLSDFLTAFYSHPNTTGFTQWGFWAGSHWLPMAALWDKEWKIRKHGKVFIDLITKTWWTNYDGQTSSKGECKLRGFTGDYEITVSKNGKISKTKCSLNTNGHYAEVIL
jgi:endo-1,4-beta-xylanase